MVSCRYSDSNGADVGHTICIAVNTDKFDNDGNLLKDADGKQIKLQPEDCAIIDSSIAIIDNIPNNYGSKEICSQLDSLIYVEKIKEYSLYLESIQVGPKCSDYARRAYQKLSTGNYLNVQNLRSNSFSFVTYIHQDVENDYERVFGSKDQIPKEIKSKLAEKNQNQTHN